MASALTWKIWNFSTIYVWMSTVHLVSLDGLVLNILNLIHTKVTVALTCMFGYVC